MPKRLTALTSNPLTQIEIDLHTIDEIVISQTSIGKTRIGDMGKRTGNRAKRELIGKPGVGEPA